MAHERKAAAGFSLAEALVALAIAAFLAAILTRFLSGTRAVAANVRQELTMDALSDDLIGRLVAADVQPGRIGGRSGALRWHLDIAPINFYSRALAISTKDPDAAKPGQSAIPGLSSMSEKADVKAKPRPAWHLYHLTVVITAPSGRSHAADTIRIGQQRTRQPSAKPATP